MIGFVFGTTAELIKAAPVLLALDPPPVLVFTGQHPAGCEEILPEIGLPSISFHLEGTRGSDLASTRQAGAWGLRVARNALRHQRSLRSALHANGRPPLVLVQGDTLTTLAGTLIGKLLRTPVAHIEAGARSGHLGSPFPEEAVRRVVDRLSTILYAAGPSHAGNLLHCKGTIRDTRVNTGLDSLRLALTLRPGHGPPVDSYGIVTLHRFELLRRPEALRGTISALLSSPMPVRHLLMPVDAQSAHYFAQAGVLKSLQTSERVVLLPKVPFPTFQHWLMRARFVITDSGGLSQECAYVGTPCLVHRESSEEVSGDRGALQVSRLSVHALRSFLERPPQPVPDPLIQEDLSPSKIVVQDLESTGFTSVVANPPWERWTVAAPA